MNTPTSPPGNRFSAAIRSRTLWLVVVLIAAAGAAYFVAHHELQSAIEAENTKFIARLKVDAQSYAKTSDSDALSVRIANDFAETVRDLQLRGVAYEIASHLVVAFLVAAIVIGAFEAQLREINEQEQARVREELARDVWRAVFHKDLPREIVHQFEVIAESNFAKRDANYHITLSDVPGKLTGHVEGEEENWILVRRELRFHICNLADDKRTYSFTSQILTTADKCIQVEISENKHKFPVGQRLNFPRHNFLRIGETTRDCNQHALELRETIELQAKGECEFVHVAFEILRINDVVEYPQRVSVVGLEVRVINDVPHRLVVEEVHLPHPEREHFKRKASDANGQWWAFSGKALLPGQGFSVTWRAKDANETAD